MRWYAVRLICCSDRRLVGSPLTRTSLSTSSRSTTSVSSKWAAMRLTLSPSRRAAMITLEVPTIEKRLEYEPEPYGVLRVSPSTTNTWSKSTPSSSATSCEMVVQWPCPSSLPLWKTYTWPCGSMRMVVEKYPELYEPMRLEEDGSTTTAMPMPTSFPRPSRRRWAWSSRMAG